MKTSDTNTNHGSSSELHKALMDHPFLFGLTSAQVAVLEENAMLKTFAAGEVIFREGEPANRFYLIQSGKVSLESNDRDRQSVNIQEIGAGDVLGWSWLFPPFYWQFDARAVEETRAIFLYGTRLREQCEGDKALGYELMKRMAAIIIKRLQATRAQLIEVAKGQGILR